MHELKIIDAWQTDEIEAEREERERADTIAEADALNEAYDDERSMGYVD
jgi:hypothetical protein